MEKEPCERSVYQYSSDCVRVGFRIGHTSNGLPVKMHIGDTSSHSSRKSFPDVQVFLRPDQLHDVRRAFTQESYLLQSASDVHDMIYRVLGQ